MMGRHGKKHGKPMGFPPAAGADLSPDVILQSAMISACGKGQQWLKSLELLRVEVPRDMKKWEFIVNHRDLMGIYHDIPIYPMLI